MNKKQKPKPKPIHLSEEQKKALKVMSPEVYKSADDIGCNKSILVGLVVKRLARMTRASGRLYFIKVLR